MPSLDALGKILQNRITKEEVALEKPEEDP